MQSAKSLEEEQAHLAGIDLSGYIRPEGEVLAGLNNSFYASHVGSAAEAMQLIADVISGYGQDLFEEKTAKGALTWCLTILARGGEEEKQ